MTGSTITADDLANGIGTRALTPWSREFCSGGQVFDRDHIGPAPEATHDDTSMPTGRSPRGRSVLAPGSAGCCTVLVAAAAAASSTPNDERHSSTTSPRSHRRGRGAARQPSESVPHGPRGFDQAIAGPRRPAGAEEEGAVRHERRAPDEARWGDSGPGSHRVPVAVHRSTLPPIQPLGSIHPVPKHRESVTNSRPPRDDFCPFVTI